jgi:hypothetical protein
VDYSKRQKISTIHVLEKEDIHFCLPKVNVKGVIIQAQESSWMDQALVSILELI